jgi:invasion protein IalB
MLIRPLPSARLPVSTALGAAFAIALASALPGAALAQSTEAPSTNAPSTEAPAALAANAPSGQSSPAGSLRGSFGAWNVICDTPTGAKFEQCAMMQNVVAADRPDVGLSVVALKTADGRSRILRVLAPLGVLLPNGLGLYIDGVDKGRAYFVRCFGDGCYAEVALEDALLNDLSKGSSAIFTVFQTPEEGIGIPVDLTDFGKAFASLP